jgi:hypothetical protein
MVEAQRRERKFGIDQQEQLNKERHLNHLLQQQYDLRQVREKILKEANDKALYQGKFITFNHSMNERNSKYQITEPKSPAPKLAIKDINEPTTLSV